MPGTRTLVQMRQLQGHLEELVWVPPSRGIADAVELYLLLAPAGQLPTPQWSSGDLLVPISTREAAQRAALLASSLGLAVRWGESRAGGSHTFTAVHLVVEGRHTSSFRVELGKAIELLQVPAAARRAVGDWPVARGVLSATLLSGSLMRRQGQGIVLRTPSAERAQLCLMAASTLGLAAACPSSKVREMRHRVHFDAENRVAMTERLLHVEPVLSCPATLSHAGRRST